MATKVAIAAQLRLRHLHQPRDNNRHSRGDGCASRVRNRRKILLALSP
jgi:hypothetical protein